jgi:tetratricopeptide (TPR) repeat protein
MKRASILAALVVLAACSHADPAARFAQARAAFAAENYAAARDAAQAGLDHDADNRAMLLLLARADLALGDGEGAGRTLARLAELGMTGREWNDLAAEAALLRGQPEEMERLLADDHSATAWRLRGEAALAKGDTAAALARFRSGMAAGADFRLAWDYARVLIDADAVDEADRALTVMRQTGPDRLDTMMTAALIAQARGQTELARAAYGQATTRFPGRFEPWLALVDLAEGQGDTKSAAAAVAHAVALAPDNPQVQSAIAQVADDQGDWEKIRKTLGPREASLDLHGRDGLFYADALRHLGHAEAARAILQQALSLSPQSPEVLVKLAECDLALGDAVGALHAVRPVADTVLAGRPELDLAIKAASATHDPALDGYVARRNSPALDATIARAKVASKAMQRRDWVAALAAWRAVPGAEGDAQVLKLMALAASRAGLADQAIGWADRALALDSANPDMLYMAGAVRLNAGRDPDAARSLLRQALERDPTNRLFRADYARAGG